MNENVNLSKILRDCLKGTKLYSTIYGDVELVRVYLDDDAYPIEIKIGEGSDMICDTTNDGRLLEEFPGECTLFPSKEQRDWSKFKIKETKFDPRTLHAFDKVLVRMSNESYNNWYADFVAEPAYTKDETPLILGAKEANMVIPYNDDTKHLVGTTDEAPEFYRYWED